MRALVGALGLEAQVSGRDLALMCQKVENLVVGAPCEWDMGGGGWLCLHVHAQLCEGICTRSGP
jgi:hypothetical protein